MSDDFNTRIEAIRRRFASTLEDKIMNAVALLPGLSGDDVNARNGVTESYLWIHGICGVASTVGFPKTGRSARDAESILMAPYRAERGLTAEEIVRLETALARLLDEAKSELRSVRRSWTSLASSE